jgi:hypothetical protein
MSLAKQKWREIFSNRAGALPVPQHDGLVVE